ncbi:Protein VAC14 -like protein [Capsicum baccatum]|uniref:Protein VAC14-like protein n=1 Tax=Capsicum baccatum TaxID=33114 RepID=A0A2G2VMZ3_CAPBA|nr:Protein VAC14 -like protein [Capsicum baccatum]
MQKDDSPSQHMLYVPSNFRKCRLRSNALTNCSRHLATCFLSILVYTGFFHCPSGKPIPLISSGKLIKLFKGCGDDSSILNSFSDQDSRVRYYACEALYNIAKVVRGDFIVFFNQIFDALCKLSADSDANVQSAAHLLDRLVKDIVTESDQFSIEEFIPLLRERMNVLNPYVRQFLVGWITVLDSVPDIDMLGFLPDFLDGLFNMLSDNSHEIRQQADSALSEFLQEIKNSPSVDYGRMAEILVQRAGSQDEFTRLTAITWINEFVKLGGDQLVPYYADILGAILPCISDKEEKIRVVARETNEELRGIEADPAEGFDVGAILSIARRQMSSEWEATRIEALHWMSTLLNRHRSEVLVFLNDVLDTLLKALSDPSDEVVLLVLEVHACIAEDPQHFRQLVVFLVHNFQLDHSLLEKRGALIIRRLCVLLDAERVYRELSSILEGESDLDFASIMVQALNLILLTASELSDLRDLLKQSLINADGKNLFLFLYASWCHSPMAIISLCLLAQAYPHASSVIHLLVEEDINVKFLVQLDKLIHLLETPTFAYLRLQKGPNCRNSTVPALKNDDKVKMNGGRVSCACWEEIVPDMLQVSFPRLASDHSLILLDEEWKEFACSIYIRQKYGLKRQTLLIE